MAITSLSFQSLLSDREIAVRVPSCALQALAGVMATAIRTMREQPGCACGIAHLDPARNPIPPLVAAAEAEHPIKPVGPFEGSEHIAGALWPLDEFDEFRGDGIAKLIFDPITLELPAHVHEHSERAIYVLRGAGSFFVTTESLDSFRGAGLRRHDVRPGTLLTFTRDVMHTFASGPPGLTLISYQSPAMAFDDPAQYTLPKVHWQPPTL